MQIPRQGDRLASPFPFGDTIASLHDEIRHRVEAALGTQYRVVSVEASLRTDYTRPYASQNEIDPARILPFLLVPGTMEWHVRATKLPGRYRPDFVELTLGFDAEGLIVLNTSIGMAY